MIKNLLYPLNELNICSYLTNYNLRVLQISGNILNTGHSVIFTADNDTKTINLYGPQIPVNLTGGPLSYRYRFNEIHIHYGLHDQFGSEHSVEGYTFPAEVNKNIQNLVFSQTLFSLSLQQKLLSLILLSQIITFN